VAGPNIAYGGASVDVDLDGGTSAARRDVANDTFTVVHSLALRGTLQQLPPEADGLVQEGVVRSTPDGYELTALGHRRHRVLLENERLTLDLGRLSMAYARLPAVTRRLRDLMLEWEANDDPDRRPAVGQLCRIIEEADPILRRTATVAPRFAGYWPRLAAARSRLLDSEAPVAFGSRVESIVTVWREMNEDYLQTLGRAHEQVDL
jgi:hypothetical protein